MTSSALLVLAPMVFVVAMLSLFVGIEVHLRRQGFRFERWSPRDRVLAVRWVRSPLGGGLRFEAPDGAFDGVIFWTTSSSVVMEALARLGWPVVGG